MIHFKLDFFKHMFSEIKHFRRTNSSNDSWYNYTISNPSMTSNKNSLNFSAGGNYH